ncbi:RusA family crossover junction endodeoxyribonuclease [Blautia hansenii]|uniref:Crossover junction endodeoxyribonuclease RusA n=1 Tax=Blautia hansenii DSM 20583 TaxID=537007 RepID=C9L7A6_BLAHA|nr:RusA family crossover junction endodeoxyribonuclease [Blautia hansenii]ASM69915.1 RusA family crossover junction endodeoxyribonuclease [Blautia hansenii DSM 20583]EEX22300.1 crossover junction endodeoxyribonuclease RusA [Blautia hansenii DSM 20583]UWO09671.1 RusA family crossover junction endodeoxyribonuclease [Blautia hansenii DSM 20583]
MEEKLVFTSPIPPSVNHYLAYRTIIKNGKPMAMSYKTKEAKDYQKNIIELIKKEVEKQRWVKSDNKFQHYYMDVVFYFPRVDMDANNYFKCLADAITDTELVWIDDTQLCERVMGIYYDNKNPRMEIEIKPVNYKGIFPNQNTYEEFVCKCETCKRYKRNCSILTKSIEGRITEDIENLECQKYKSIEKEDK